MKFNNRKIGIWGLGVVGKSAVRYLHAHGAQLQVLDNRTLTEEEQAFLMQRKICWFGSDKLLTFLENNDFILPSPGIDLRPYAAYQSQWLSELDIFRDAYKKQIIAITGSVGKTSITHLLSAILSSHYRVATGGNIGTAMLDLLATPSDIAILETSSFQLDLCKTFSPDLAIWTNFYPNHLDRHGSEQEYFRAKAKILTWQQEEQKALIPLEIYEKLMSLSVPDSHNTNTDTAPFVLSVTKDTNATYKSLATEKTSPLTYPTNYSAISKVNSENSPFAPFDKLRANGFYLFSPTPPNNSELASIDPSHTLFYIQNNQIIMRSNNHEQPLISLSDLPDTSFTENWLIICAALTLLNIPLTMLSTIKDTLTVPEHRLEKVATINNITFYNDSKSTTPQSTLAALTQLQGAPIHLFIGGMSKGIDRKPFIKELKGRVKQVYCFGKESEHLYNLCVQEKIPAYCSATLEEAVALCAVNSMPGEYVIFSPAGASFDLFKDYKERGNRFKELVFALSSVACPPILRSY